MKPYNRRVLIWRGPGRRNHPRFIRKRPWSNFNDVSQMKMIHFLFEEMYLDEVLRSFVLLYAGAVGEQFVDMNAKTPSYRANI